jgi:hypothetical protein
MSRRLPYWMIYGGVVFLIYIASFFIPADYAVPASLKFTDPAKATLDLVLAIVQLITALDTALLAAAGAITVKRKEWSTRWNYVDGLLVLVVFICGAVSYYGIYLGHVALLSTAAKGVINPFETRFQWALRLEYYGLLLGVFLLGLVIARMLEDDESTLCPRGRAT